MCVLRSDACFFHTLYVTSRQVGIHGNWLFSSSSQMAPQSNEDFRLLNGLVTVRCFFFSPLFPGNWLLGHSVSGQMKPNNCPWNFRYITWKLFYYSAAERDWFYQYSLIGVFIILRGKGRKKMGVFIFPCWETAKILCIRTPNSYTKQFYSAPFVLQG